MPCGGRVRGVCVCVWSPVLATPGRSVACFSTRGTRILLFFTCSRWERQHDDTPQRRALDYLPIVNAGDYCLFAWPATRQARCTSATRMKSTNGISTLYSILAPQRRRADVALMHSFHSYGITGAEKLR